MSVRLAERGVSAVLLDIEGTTTPIAFVHQVLFPFARVHLAHWIERHQHDAGFADLVRLFSEERADDHRRGESVPEWSATSSAALSQSLQAYVRWLMDRDRKSRPLKELQGCIWEEGYRSGELRGQFFSDVPAAIRRWRAEGVTIAIYSSGSELAQRRLFASSAYGDLTPCVSSFFDTAVGSKRDAASYARIAAAVRCEPSRVLFVSDVTAELTAAREAGCQVVLSIRPGNPAQTDSDEFEAVTTFDLIE